MARRHGVGLSGGVEQFVHERGGVERGGGIEWVVLENEFTAGGREPGRRWEAVGVLGAAGSGEEGVAVVFPEFVDGEEVFPHGPLVGSRLKDGDDEDEGRGQQPDDGEEDQPPEKAKGALKDQVEEGAHGLASGRVPAGWLLARLLRGEGGLDGLGDFFAVGGGFGVPAFDELAVAADEEFAEVPFHVTGELRGRAGEGGVEGVLVRAFDVELVEEGEGDVVFAGAEFFDLVVGAGFLSAELVAGEAEDDEALVFEFPVGGFEGFVLRGVAAFGGDVDDEEDFAFVGGEAGVFAVDVFEGDLGEVGGGVGGHGDGKECGKGEECFHGGTIAGRARVVNGVGVTLIRTRIKCLSVYWTGDKHPRHEFFRCFAQAFYHD